MTLSLNKNGLMVILSSPSGAGKTTLARKLVSSDNNFVLSISATTRQKRKDETNGIDYYFISKEEFREKIKHGDFLEYAEVFNNLYGTPKSQTFQLLEDGKDIVYDIDWQGASQLTQSAQNHVVTIFILPPSMSILRDRLLSRNSESADSFNIRFSEAKNEINKCGLYEYIIINEDIESSLAQIKHIVAAERQKTKRQNISEIISSFE